MSRHDAAYNHDAATVESVNKTVAAVACKGATIKGKEAAKSEDAKQAPQKEAAGAR